MKSIYAALFSIFLNASIYGITVTSGITTISGTGTNVNPLVKISNSGKGMAIWTEAFPNRVETAFFNGASWAAPVILANGSFPQLGIDSKGNALAIWLNTGTNQVFASRFNVATTTWSTPVQLSTGGINSAPQIAVNSSGNALAVWILSSPQRIIASTFNASTLTWSAAATLVTGSVSFPQTDVNNSNKGIITWLSTSFDVEAITVTIP